MNYADIEYKVKEVLAAKLNIDTAHIKPSSFLVEDLGMDSFGSIETLFELEEKFEIDIPDTDIRKAKMVKDIVDYLFERVERRPRPAPAADAPDEDRRSYAQGATEAGDARGI
jgi:acyl carrier protein